MSTIEKLTTQFGQAITVVPNAYGEEVISVKRAHAKEVLAHLKNSPDLAFDLLLDLCGVDYLGKSPRFEAVYHLYSLTTKGRLRVRVPLDDMNPEMDSVIPIWPTADWYEREAYDMFGFIFKGHPSLQRILMWDEFEGHPLRKDYPLNKRQPIPEPKDIL